MNISRSRLPFLLVILIILAVSPSDSAATILDGTVVKNTDGDTFTVLDSAKQQHRVRIAGIDAPEKNQPFGNASRKRLVELVARKDVRVEFNKHDRYGRIVGKVLVTPRVARHAATRWTWDSRRSRWEWRGVREKLESL